MGATVIFAFDEGLSELGKKNVLLSLPRAVGGVAKAAFYEGAGTFAQANSAHAHQYGFVEFNRASGIDSLVEKVKAQNGVAAAKWLKPLHN